MAMHMGNLKSARVLSVYDGDTIWVGCRRTGRMLKVRLRGLDCRLTASRTVLAKNDACGCRARPKMGRPARGGGVWPYRSASYSWAAIR